MSLCEDSCLTLGVTMAGCGMPVVCRLWWGGTMWGGNLEVRKPSQSRSLSQGQSQSGKEEKERDGDAQLLGAARAVIPAGPCRGCSHCLQVLSLT